MLKESYRCQQPELQLLQHGAWNPHTAFPFHSSFCLLGRLHASASTNHNLFSVVFWLLALAGEAVICFQVITPRPLLRPVRQLSTAVNYCNVFQLILACGLDAREAEATDSKKVWNDKESTRKYFLDTLVHHIGQRSVYYMSIPPVCSRNYQVAVFQMNKHFWRCRAVPLRSTCVSQLDGCRPKQRLN